MAASGDLESYASHSISNLVASDNCRICDRVCNRGGQRANLGDCNHWHFIRVGSCQAGALARCPYSKRAREQRVRRSLSSRERTRTSDVGSPSQAVAAMTNAFKHRLPTTAALREVVLDGRTRDWLAEGPPRLDVSASFGRGRLTRRSNVRESSLERIRKVGKMFSQVHPRTRWKRRVSSCLCSLADHLLTTVRASGFGFRDRGGDHAVEHRDGLAKFGCEVWSSTCLRRSAGTGVSRSGSHGRTQSW